MQSRAAFPGRNPFPGHVRTLVVVLGDQLDPDSDLLTDLDPAHDLVWMCEASGEADHVWSHQARIAVFLSAMRHLALTLDERGIPVCYRRLDVEDDADLLAALESDLDRFGPEEVRVMEPGEWRLEAGLAEVAERWGRPFEVLPDRHFLCSRTDFDRWLADRSVPRMEHFYRAMRRRTGYLMDGDQPAAGRWNFDTENRGSFGPDGPGLTVGPRAFRPDAVTQEVLDLVRTRFGSHPGSLDAFDWPLTRPDALLALDDFIEHRLGDFGSYQDAMTSGAPWPDTLLFHSRLSVALNLKLLDPREVCEAAVAAYHAGTAPIASVEGFVRQVLGWREYVRGLYWARMPQFADMNELGANEPLPGLYWDAGTDLNCLHQTVSETLAHGYAHHIQRLMVTGLFGLLLGVDPAALHRWYLAVYVDAVEWVELPNTIGMSQYADGGYLGSKPYIATGKYIDRMSDYCGPCRYRPDRAVGPDACPITTLYWDFLGRHHERFAGHPRMALQVRNLERKSGAELTAIRDQAAAFRESLRPAEGPRPVPSRDAAEAASAHAETASDLQKLGRADRI
ncbi:MAG: cryptochrome/photolyase family protein [Propionibacteriales bacterium]|nr:cryptochrome/photolyase family protein [Propionibacteriales bacterium]